MKVEVRRCSALGSEATAETLIFSGFLPVAYNSVCATCPFDLSSETVYHICILLFFDMEAICNNSESPYLKKFIVG